jgi:hypothetical protein
MSEAAEVQDVVEALGYWKASTQWMCNMASAGFALQAF